MKLDNLSCRRRVVLMLDFLDRELPSSKRKLLARHRASCRPCASLLKTLERTVLTLKALNRRAKPPSSLRRSLAASLRLQ